MQEQRWNDLLVRYRSVGDPEAIATLFDETAPRLLPLALHLTKNAADAEDLLQTTYLEVIESVDRYDPNRPVTGWLTGILTNCARHQARQGARAVDPERLEERVEPEPERELETEETRREVRSAVERLPQLYRQAVELVVQGGMGPTEIASRLGRSPGAVRTQLHRAVAMMRETLPPETALPVGLAIFELARWSEVRNAVSAKAMKAGARAVRPAVVGGGALKIAALVLGVAAVGGGVMALLRLPDPAQDRSPVELAALPEAAASSAHAPTATMNAPLATAGRLSANVDAQPDEEPLLEVSLDRVETRDFDLYVGQSYSFEVESSTSSAADFVYEGRRKVRVDEPARIASLRFSWDHDGSAQRSADCYQRSILALDPEAIEWADRVKIKPRDPSSSAFLLRLRNGGYASVAILGVVYDPVVRRYKARVRATINPDGPRFAPQSGAAKQHHGVEYDFAAFATDPFQAELDARRARALAELDEEVARFEGLVVDESGVGVAGVLSRCFADTIDASDWSFTASTYSFEHANRDDASLTQNDWSLFFESNAPARLRVRSVTDDRGRIWDLGEVDHRAASDDLTPETPWSETVDLVEGHTYLLHTLDTDTDRWDLMRVVQIRRDDLELGPPLVRWMIFEWRPLNEATTREVLERLRRPEGEIQDAEVHVQMRAGAGGGNSNRVFLDGSKNAYLDSIEPRELDLSGAIDSHEDSRAFVHGGTIPVGRVWVVEAIYYDATTAGDTNGSGGFRIEVAGQTIVQAGESERPTAGVWRGELFLRPGDEARSFVEVNNSSQCDVRFVGEMIDE